MLNLDLLPHRDPFRFVSCVDSIEPGVRGDAQWDVTGDEAFFEGHFPGNPLVPGVLLTESLSQLSGMVAFSGEQTTAISPARLAHVNIKFLHAVRPPASIKIHSQLIRHMAGLYIFDVQARVDGVVMAEGAVVLSAQSDRNHQEVPE